MTRSRSGLGAIPIPASLASLYGVTPADGDGVFASGGQLALRHSTGPATGFPVLSASPNGTTDGLGTQAMADASQAPVATIYANDWIVATGAITADRTLTLPAPATDAASYSRTIINSCTGTNFAVLVSIGSGTTIRVRNGATRRFLVTTAGVQSVTGVNISSDYVTDTSIATGDLVASIDGMRYGRLPKSSGNGRQVGTGPADGALGYYDVPTWGPGDWSAIAEAFDFAQAQAQAALAPSGTVYKIRVKVPQGRLVTSIGIKIPVGGSAITVALAGIYQNRVRLAQTADQSAVWITTGAKKMALTAPVSVLAGYVDIALLFVGTTGPQINRGYVAPGGSYLNQNLSAPDLRFAIADAGVSALPSTLGTESTSNQAFYAWIE